jgi:hypothetical protein
MVLFVIEYKIELMVNKQKSKASRVTNKLRQDNPKQDQAEVKPT